MDAIPLINYPVVDFGVFGGGLIVAVIATLHVYVAHFAVGGGFFLVLTEMKARREKDPAILAYVRAHARFFLLLTMVFGAISGVGIWFSISVTNPSATGVLIQRFVFAWATEWTFFVAEIATLFIYYSTFDRLSERDHLRVGWLYVAFAWLSLFAVNGMVAFMLTPGDWLETERFWDGFFNPSFWPSLWFRTFMALMLAGLFGFVTAAFSRKADHRARMMRHCAWWLVLPLPLVLMAGWWYTLGLPYPQRATVLTVSPETLPMIRAFLWITPVLMIAGLVMALRAPLALKRGVAIILLVLGLAHMGAFEWAREAGRRPFILFGYEYSNGVRAADFETVREQGVLRSARWTQHKEITDANQAAAGRDLFGYLCLPCHSVGGVLSDIRPLTSNYTAFGMAAAIDGMGEMSPYMPPFPGTPVERDALAAYIAYEINGRRPETLPDAPDAIEPVAVPPFRPETDDYILLAWSDLGMHTFTDADARLSIRTPGADFHALLIRRGEYPEIVMDGVTLTYAVEAGFDQPEAAVDFWDGAEALTGKDLPPGVGPDGWGTAGEMAFDLDRLAWSALGVPVVPYPADGGFKPYPLVTVEAHDDETGEQLAATRTSLPVSTEMGCRHCHGGDWRIADAAGISSRTAEGILSVHDRRSGTDLTGSGPHNCRGCHDGDHAGETLNLSAAIHGFHAPYLDGRGSAACGACHPLSPDTFTAGLRGIHQKIGLGCTNCHGTLADHAQSLLLAERETGKRAADRLLGHLPESASPPEQVARRRPWVNQPDCLHCHIDFGMPETDMVPLHERTGSAAGLFRNRSDDVGIACAACHGSPHAIHPAENRYGSGSIGPIQYQKNPFPIAANRSCGVCHTVDMETPIHHPNSLADFRNDW
jgi:cytochrome bd-type quinol oxidase subunit 1